MRIMSTNRYATETVSSSGYVLDMRLDEPREGQHKPFRLTLQDPDTRGYSLTLSRKHARAVRDFLNEADTEGML